MPGQPASPLSRMSSKTMSLCTSSSVRALWVSSPWWSWQNQEDPSVTASMWGGVAPYPRAPQVSLSPATHTVPAGSGRIRRCMGLGITV